MVANDMDVAAVYSGLLTGLIVTTVIDSTALWIIIDSVRPFFYIEALCLNTELYCCTPDLPYDSEHTLSEAHFFSINRVSRRA